MSVARDGADAIAIIEADGTIRELDTPFSEVSQVVAIGDDHDALVVAGTPVTEAAPYLVYDQGIVNRDRGQRVGDVEVAGLQQPGTGPRHAL